jgi:hypothetical protein
MGVCEGPADAAPGLSTVHLSREGDDHEDVFVRGLQWIGDRLRAQRPDWLVVEAPVSPGSVAGQTNVNTTLRLTGLWAIIAAAARVKNISYRRAHLQTVLAELGIRGR